MKDRITEIQFQTESLVPVTFSIQLGITENQIDQLIKFASSDTKLRQFTSDPKRFSDRNEYDKWKSGGRTIYTLVDNQQNLSGIIWFGKKEPHISKRDILENFDPNKLGITFAIRTYGETRGKGIGRHFMEETFKHFQSLPETQALEKQGMWLETSVDNIPAVRLYQKFGFRTVTTPDEAGKIIMIL